MLFTVVNLSQQAIPSSRSCGLLKAARYKFVLISVGEEHCFVFGPVGEFAYHANLVDSFCSTRGIPSGWVREPERIEVYDRQVRIRGGGWMYVSADESAIRMYGQSTAYGRFDREILQLLKENDSFFDRFHVEITG